MGKKAREKKRAAKAVKPAADVAMDTAEPEAAAPVGKDGWFTGAGAAVLQATTEDAAMAVDTAAVEKAVNWKAMPKGALLKMKVAGVTKARGQRTKAQQLRKVQKLEKALASNDRYAGRCDKSRKTKEVKTLLAHIY